MAFRKINFQTSRRTGIPVLGGVRGRGTPAKTPLVNQRTENVIPSPGLRQPNRSTSSCLPVSQGHISGGQGRVKRSLSQDQKSLLEPEQMEDVFSGDSKTIVNDLKVEGQEVDDEENFCEEEEEEEENLEQ